MSKAAATRALKLDPRKRAEVYEQHHESFINEFSKAISKPGFDLTGGSEVLSDQEIQRLRDPRAYNDACHNELETIKRQAAASNAGKKFSDDPEDYL